MKVNTKKLTSIGVLAGISYVLMMVLEFPLPFMPPFLKLDLSTVPALIAGFMFGPVAGVLVALVKDLLHLLSTQTGGVGELADFICTTVIVVLSSTVYFKNKTRKGALMGLVLGTLGITVVGALVNMYILIPFYSKIMPIEAIFDACGNINPYIGSLSTYVLFGAAPFNFIKGVILSAITMLLYKRISKIFR